MSDRPPVGLVVLTWNGREDTERCLSSLARVSYPALTTLVVDNGSIDNTAEMVGQRFPSVRVVRNLENLGFAAGTNCGIVTLLAEGFPFIGVLNNDTVVSVGFLDPLIEALESDDNLGAVAPLIDYLAPHNGSERPWFAGGVIDPVSGLPVHEQVGAIPIGTMSTHFLTGCCIVAPRSTFIEVGQFDERYFLMFEDSDWSKRVTATGRTLAVVPESRIRHSVSASFDRSQSFVGCYYFVRNALLFLSDYSASPLPHIGRFIVREVLRRSASDALHRRSRRAGVARLAGLVAFVLHRWGPAPRLVERLTRQPKVSLAH